MCPLNTLRTCIIHTIYIILLDRYVISSIISLINSVKIAVKY